MILRKVYNRKWGESNGLWHKLVMTNLFGFLIIIRKLPGGGQFKMAETISHVG
jgi:hypothetical protein